MLYKGPDLTNSLVGVLTRFREDRIAVMADIEAMFHQVRVPDRDSTFLRFLWWDDGDTTREVQEYQMLVHLFGALSSPASANFALRQTADDNKNCFPTEVINTVFRNFYVVSPFPQRMMPLHMLTTFRPYFQEAASDLQSGSVTAERFYKQFLSLNYLKS